MPNKGKVKRSKRSVAKSSGWVFVSYAHEDRNRVRPLVDCLATAKLNVWWDDQIAPGEIWAEVLQEKLWKAACVVVVWSKNSVKSLFVRAEARETLNRATLEESSEFAILQGVKIDKVPRLPLPFGELQYLDLTGWHGTPCGALRPLVSAARTLARRTTARDYSGTLAAKPPVDSSRHAAANLRQLVERIDSLRDVLSADAQPAADLRVALAEVHKTYDVVNTAIEAFVSPAVSGDGVLGEPYSKMERGSLNKLIRDGRGHCELIAHHYGRRGGLRDWLKQHTTSKKLQQADDVFGRLSTADGDLFIPLAEIGKILTNESRAIVNLLLTDQRDAARKRIARGRRRLEPLEKELDKGMRQLQKLEQRLGYTPGKSK